MLLPGSYCRFCLALLVVAFTAANLTAQAPAPPKKGPFPPSKTPVPPSGVTATGPKAPVPPSAANPAAPKSPATSAPSSAKAKGPKVPDPEDINLDAKIVFGGGETLTIKATYYAGTLKKEAIPFILIHGLDGQRGDMHGLAVYLQTLGHAAIAPDLRGHGQSKSQKLLDGTTKNLDPDKMTKPQLESMVNDVLACKKYLLDKNNAGEVNIEQLCVVGAEFGAILALHFAAKDWSTQDLPNYKLGKFVKALVLLSPPASFKGVNLREAMAVPGVSTAIAMLIVAGSEDAKSSSESDKLAKQMETHHSKSDEKDVFLIKPETRLSGAKLLGSNLDVKEKIGAFIDRMLVSKKANFAWEKRENPLH
jgi:pimeloyl-ACP methyl ester carboxylesterase